MRHKLSDPRSHRLEAGPEKNHESQDRQDDKPDDDRPPRRAFDGGENSCDGGSATTDSTAPRGYGATIDLHEYKVMARTGAR